MNENNVWEIVDRPLNKREEKNLNKVDSRWVFTRKTGDGEKELFKARLVIRGFKDKSIYELTEIYAPVTRLPLIRAALAIANELNLHLFQLDGNKKFNAEIKKLGLENDVHEPCLFTWRLGNLLG